MHRSPPIGPRHHSVHEICRAFRPPRSEQSRVENTLPCGGGLGPRSCREDPTVSLQTGYGWVRHPLTWKLLALKCMSFLLVCLRFPSIHK
jgi:hypothetical protein